LAAEFGSQLGLWSSSYPPLLAFSSVPELRRTELSNSGSFFVDDGASAPGEQHLAGQVAKEDIAKSHSELNSKQLTTFPARARS
jgi:hypothetical protein